ncbi:MAG: 6-carboxytetrahydropterin synthase [Flavobacteriales bacterium]|jgi:6-pyruvoyltetrahydropterin/6-carboxytetrahydropterin synthase|uniref:6-pyruvoyl trahydropterin synthase family protein n=1 Tax=Blattabacterium sp. (Mastotermes darwiniensis) TaxID=39768 RepID=UPI000231DEA0|nr:6-carboxytetrahydropterin synthase [Blattabacterium sp. (Mastotermes darwiniensis)]AER40724.1 6-pyruvoyl tetrahydrobiopterin synthase [Blattabacterium sp. (Mastotermes darwiniensis) str. MADAR]MDR1804748.1 6-carboxytetrahydropterin synthase [Flavobacteriales bacterium]
MKATISRKGYFSAAHKLYNNHWNRHKNIETFGKCAYLNYHGHNYEYIVSITGEVDPETGFVFSIQKLKNLLREEIEVIFDHKNINLDIKEFSVINPTTENIVIFIWNRINQKINPHLDLKITLYETTKNFAEYNGS